VNAPYEYTQRIRLHNLVHDSRPLSTVTMESVAGHEDEILSVECVLDEAMRDLNRGLKLN
jgi:hypothetical protein